MLIQLHWLSIKAIVNYKIAFLVFKCLNGLAPVYLSNLISTYKPSKTLRSSSSMMLNQVTSRYEKLGDRPFSSYAPLLWNKLPVELKRCRDINSLKRHLKTYLFGCHFD